MTEKYHWANCPSCKRVHRFENSLIIWICPECNTQVDTRIYCDSGITWKDFAERRHRLTIGYTLLRYSLSNDKFPDEDFYKTCEEENQWELINWGKELAEIKNGTHPIVKQHINKALKDSK